MMMRANAQGLGRKGACKPNRAHPALGCAGRAAASEACAIPPEGW